MTTLELTYKQCVETLRDSNDPAIKAEAKVKKSIAVDAMFAEAASQPTPAARREARHRVKAFLQATADEMHPQKH